AGRLRGGVAGDATGEGELPEEAAHPLFVTPDVWVDLAVRALEPGVGDDARSTVSWAGDVDGVEVARSDDPVHVCVHEVEAGRRPPVTEEPGLDLVGTQRLAQQRVVEQVDLSHRQVVGGAPPCVNTTRIVIGQRDRGGGGGAGNGAEVGHEGFLRVPGLPSETLGAVSLAAPASRVRT